MFVSFQNSYSEILNSKAMVLGCRDFESWLGHKEGVLMNKTNALQETSQSSPVLFTVGGHSEKMATCEVKSRLSSDTQTAGALILDIPTSRTVRNVPVYKPHRVWYCVIAQYGLRTHVLRSLNLENQTRSDQISRSVMPDSLRPHESQQSRPPCPSPIPRVHWDSRPSS